MSQTILWWIRRDFRLHDNTALFEALQDGHRVLPVFILDEKLIHYARMGGYRLVWMLEGLQALDADLRSHGSRLIFRRGDVLTELQKLIVKNSSSSTSPTSVEAVYFNRDYSPFAIKRDQEVTSFLNAQGIVVKAFKDLVVHEPYEVINGSGKPYEVYTPYRNAWSKLPKPPVLPPPSSWEKLVVPDSFESLKIPLEEFSDSAAPEPICVAGEKAARERLSTFAADSVYRYGSDRDLPDRDGTSLLSPYFRWGMLSPRTAYWAGIDALERTTDRVQQEGVTKWINELVWREFNYQILASYPYIVKGNFRPVYDKMAWQHNPEHLRAWQDGKTGYPIVDAGMRQLAATGWMHNRVRMIVASFLVKDLLIDWREGERHFMRLLLDGDVANNVGGWQWVAGTGTDAAPYFRIFNPTSQGEKFDPNGDFVRRWVPELATVPTKYIHQPESMAVAEQLAYNCVLGKDYPLPIVNHATQRDRVLEMYAAAREPNQ